MERTFEANILLGEKTHIKEALLIFWMNIIGYQLLYILYYTISIYITKHCIVVASKTETRIVLIRWSSLCLCSYFDTQVNGKVVWLELRTPIQCQ